MGDALCSQTTFQPDHRGSVLFQFTLLALFAVTLIVPIRTASAIEFFCEPADICEWVPRDASGEPAYNHTDPNLPWVIGGDDVVSLEPGEYDVGVGPVGAPMVFVIEDGTLEIDGLGDDWAGLGAWMILCDDATFRVRDSTYRLLQDFGFQYPLFALGNSRVEYGDARFHTLREEHEEAGNTGHFLQVMGEQSELDARPEDRDYSVHFTVPGDAWELGVVHQAQADVISADIWAEFYVQGQARFNIEDTQSFIQFIEVCDGESFHFQDPPELCTVGDPDVGCLTDAHEPLDFSLGPPQHNYELTIANSRVVAWNINSLPGSEVIVENAPRDANVAYGLRIDDDLDLRLTIGEKAIIEGLTDRVLQVEDSHVFAWMVWPTEDALVRILPGSVVGDVIPGDNSVAEVYESLLTGAMLAVTEHAELHVFDSTIDERTDNMGGKFWATRSPFTDDIPVVVTGPTWLADTPTPAGLDIRPGGSLYEVSLSEPADGAQISSSEADVVGTVQARSQAGVITPFPQARLEVVDADSEQVVEVLATLDAPHQEVQLGIWDTSTVDEGWYELRLYFDDEDGARAVARREIYVEGAEDEEGPEDVEVPEDEQGQGETADPDESPDAGEAHDSEPDAGGPEADAGIVKPVDGDDGCGCSSSGGNTIPFAVMILLVLLALKQSRPLISSTTPATAVSLFPDGN